MCNFTEKRLWHMSLLNRMPCMPLCQRGLCANVVYVPTCLCASMVYVPTCQKHANFSFLHASMPINVQMCHMACQCFNLACQHAKRCTNFSSWHAMCQKACKFFKHFSSKMLKEISKLYYYIKILNFT